MNCEQVQSLLPAYLDGEVSPSERALIRAHLSKCTVCQQELDLLSTARSRVRSTLQRRAAQAAPSREAWSRLEARLSKMQVSFLPEAAQPSSKFMAWFARKAPRGSRAPNQLFGGVTMQKRWIFSGLAGVVVLSVLAVLVAQTATPVSARQILDRAYEAQTQVAPAQGIEHIRNEVYSNLEGKSDGQGMDTTVESYLDHQTDNFRLVVTDNKTGQVLAVTAYDGANAYSSDSKKGEELNADPLTIYRTPQNQPSEVRQKLQVGNKELDAKTMFDKMRNDPQVQVVGKETWEDGRTVYVLHSEQEIKVIVGNEVQHPIGSVDVYFDVETYELLGNRVTMQKDGKELLISLQRILVDETLPEESSVAWDLSDLQGVNIVDDTNGEHQLPEAISAEDLATKTKSAYLLETIPEGFSLELNALPEHPANRPFFYEATYTNQAGDYFIIRAFDNKKLEDTSWADETYTTASGLVLYFVNQPSIDPKFTGGLLETPDGMTFAIDSTLPREQVRELVEQLVLVK